LKAVLNTIKGFQDYRIVLCNCLEHDYGIARLEFYGLGKGN